MEASKQFLARLLALGALLLLAGCAFGTRHVTLTYPPEEEAGFGPPSAVAASLSPGADTELVVVRFVDRRPHKETIGEVQNALGMRTAAVETDTDIANWITQAVKFEFEKAGYQVKTVARDSRPEGQPTLEGEVLNLHCSAYWSYNGEIRFFATLEANDKKLLAKEYIGKGSAGTNWGMTEKSYGETISLALADALHSLVQDVSRSLAPK